jgi:hypothetical protein
MAADVHVGAEESVSAAVAQIGLIAAPRSRWSNSAANSARTVTASDAKNLFARAFRHPAWFGTTMR